MDGFFIEFRDPLFGIIVFFVFIFFVALTSYWWGRYKSKDEQKKLSRFLEQFEMSESDHDLVVLINNKSLSEESLVLLAQLYYKVGEFEKSIQIYQSLLEQHTLQNLGKNEMLLLLGKTYFRAGFLERAKKVYEEILKKSPRTVEALQYLLLIYEQLRAYEQAQEVLEPLDELGQEISQEYDHVKVHKIIHDLTLDNDEKVARLVQIYTSTHHLTYPIFEFLFRVDPKNAWEVLDQSQCGKIVDLLWNLEKENTRLDIISSNNYLKELYSAKGYYNLSAQSDIFEFDVLIKLEKNIATLQFAYGCKKCKHTFPFAFYRCPNCYSIDSQHIQLELTRETFEKNLSFQ